MNLVNVRGIRFKHNIFGNFDQDVVLIETVV
jgi:hypothetical protein